MFSAKAISSSPFLIEITLIINVCPQGEEAIHVMERVMFMLPGLEGCAAVMEPLCRRLKIKVCVLQLGVEHKNETMDQMVTRLHQVSIA